MHGTYIKRVLETANVSVSNWKLLEEKQKYNLWSLAVWNAKVYSRIQNKAKSSVHINWTKLNWLQTRVIWAKPNHQPLAHYDLAHRRQRFNLSFSLAPIARQRSPVWPIWDILFPLAPLLLPLTLSKIATLVQRIPSAWARFHLCWSRESSPVHSLNYRSFSPRILDPPAKECQTWTFYLGLNASIYIYWLWQVSVRTGHAIYSSIWCLLYAQPSGSTAEPGLNMIAPFVAKPKLIISGIGALCERTCIISTRRQ